MKNIKIKQIKALLKAMEKEDYDKASQALDEIIATRDDNLLEQVEQIAQNLHDTLEQFGADSMLLQHTKHGLPDATERLEYVIETTEEASNKTLSAAENAIALLETLESHVTDDSQKELIGKAQSEVTEIMMAQSFQDLTGQVLNRVIMLVTSLEQSLMELINKSGIHIDDIPDPSDSEEERKAQEMKGIGPNVTKSSQQNAVNSQDEVDDLLGDLGI
uniref:Protein phosphatase CheZ n=1 Tax=Hydrogenovibrio crunogenus (strain DSM 25203 / XCL-2) TaxID=317025 RepID=Q31HM8_HYDCU